MRRNAFWTRKGTPFREERQKRLASRSMAIGRKCTPRFDHGWKWREEKDRTSAPFFDLRKHSLPAFVFGAIRTEVLVRPTRFPRSGSGWFPNICSSIEALHIPSYLRSGMFPLGNQAPSIDSHSELVWNKRPGFFFHPEDRYSTG